MRRRLFLCIVVWGLCFLGVASAGTSEVKAQKLLEKPKHLKENKTYSYDIDGDGEKEKLRFESEADYDNYVVTTTVYVGGKKYASVKEKGSFDHNVFLCDLYAKKKGMNLIMYGTADSDTLTKLQVYKFGTRTLEKVAAMKPVTKGIFHLNRMLGKVVQALGEGAFYLYPDTPVYLNYFGCYYTKVKCQIKGGKIQLESQTEYPYQYEYVFRLNVDMKLYSQPDLESAADVVEKGTKMTVLRVRPVKRDGDGRTTSFVKVKLSNGTAGWVYDEPIPDYESYGEVFVSMPAWG